MPCGDSHDPKGTRGGDAHARTVAELEARIAELEVALAVREAGGLRAPVESALRESERRLNRAQEIAHLGSWELDLIADRLVWSDEVYRIFGLRPQQFAATYEAFLAAVHPDDRAAVDAAYSDSLRHGKEGYEIEHRVVRKSTGEVRIVREKCEHLRDETGRVVGSFGMVHDVTEHRQAVDALRESERRQRELAAALREADRRKDEFLAVLSHELRNPLAPIRNSLFVLRHAAAGGAQACRATAVIERQVGHLARIVDDLLDVTRIVHGVMQVRRGRVDLGELVRQVTDDHREAFDAAGVRLEERIAPAPIPLDADATRIVQVLENLLQNALKFTPRGGRVVVTLERGDGTAVLRVSDTGMGIGPEMLGRLFEPFAQARQPLDRSCGGLGLGLSLVKGLVELHQGTVEAASEGAGCGATFTLRLPLQPSAPPPAGTGRAGGGVRRRVLIIEDNVDAADTLKEALELMGHVACVAYDGPGGLAAAREFRPDAVLCDIGLPLMNGFEVARAFRSDAALRGVHLVALSGYALPEDLERSAAAGFERHLAKPPSLEQVEALLAELGS